MSDAPSHTQPRAAQSRASRLETGSSVREQAFELWGAYFWALSVARHTLGHQLVSPTASFGIHLTLMGEYAPLPDGDPRREKIRHYADVMSQELERLKIVRDRGVNQLRSSLEPGESRPGLSEVLADLEWLMKPMAIKREAAWELNATEDAPVPGDPVAFHHALFILLTLAIQQLSKGDRINVTVERARGTMRVAIRTQTNDPSTALAGWFPAVEAPSGPPGTLGIALRSLEQQNVHWDAPTCPGEPIAVHWHLEDTET